jgi:transcription antitermination protein NusB
VPDVADRAGSRKRTDPDERGRIGSRHEARERALSLLYEAESKSITPDEVVADLPVEPDPFTAVLCQGVTEHGPAIDETIQRFAKNWDLARMPALDRAILRIGVFELAHLDDVPRNVVINEAVELAKRYSTDESGRFVNGMLARIADEVRG